MRVLDLFSGIGGFSLGLERVGMRTRQFVELDPFCRAVLAEHWPRVPCHDDIRTFNAPPGFADVICGGFPCQDISVAGTGAGLSGARSGLWSEYARIISQVGPRYVIVENVAMLLGRGLGEVLGDLATIGYDSEWHCIPASAIGAPHRRDRIWIVAYPSDDRYRQPLQSVGERGSSAATDTRSHGEVWPMADSDSERQPQPQGPLIEIWRWLGDGSGAVGDSDSSRLSSPGPQPIGENGRESGRMPSPADWWAVEPGVGRMAHGVPARVDRLRSLGNSVVPQIPEIIGRAIMRAEQCQ